MAAHLSRRGSRALSIGVLCGLLGPGAICAGELGAAGEMREIFPPATPQTAAARGAYGGGFIELLLTGEDPSRRLGYFEPATPPGNDAPTRFAPQRGVAPQMNPQRAVSPEYMRREVPYPGREAPGSIVVDTRDRFLYYIRPGGRAIRYGVGVGRPGFEWTGVKSVTRKAAWPGWTPPREMLARRPDLPRHMAGGPENPLGARALYLGGSLYRIHGTNEPDTIGQNVSSGCIRMMNDDMVDLYERVRVGTRVVVR